MNNSYPVLHFWPVFSSWSYTDPLFEIGWLIHEYFQYCWSPSLFVCDSWISSALCLLTDPQTPASPMHNYSFLIPTLLSRQNYCCGKLKHSTTNESIHKQDVLLGQHFHVTHLHKVSTVTPFKTKIKQQQPSPKSLRQNHKQKRPLT